MDAWHVQCDLVLRPLPHSRGRGSVPLLAQANVYVVLLTAVKCWKSGMLGKGLPWELLSWVGACTRLCLVTLTPVTCWLLTPSLLWSVHCILGCGYRSVSVAAKSTVRTNLFAHSQSTLNSLCRVITMGEGVVPWMGRREWITIKETPYKSHLSVIPKRPQHSDDWYFNVQKCHSKEMSILTTS